MAKIAFTKLGLKVNNTINTVVWENDENKYDIEVKYYLPVEKKLDLMSNIVNYSVDENGYYNPMRLKIYSALEIIYAYTNINFTDKMKEDPLKLYDLIISSGLYDKIIENISINDIKEINNEVEKIINNIYNYKNSAYGILNTIATDYDSLNMDVGAVMDKITDPDSLSLIKQIAPLV